MLLPKFGRYTYVDARVIKVICDDQAEVRGNGDFGATSGNLDRAVGMYPWYGFCNSVNLQYLKYHM